MGKSSSSCLKIITCGGGGGESSENEDLAPSETKTSSDKRRWSFHKKSAGNRVLSNSAISEPLSVVYSKETLVASPNNFDSPIQSSIPEKTHVEDKPRETSPKSSAIANAEAVSVEVAVGDNSNIDDNLQESAAVFVQVAIRGYLAQKELLKLKNVVKLQAVVRGHLVRRQAIGTLRCIQAIVKMQALVRLRHAQQSIEKLEAEKGKGGSCISTKKSQSSVQILLSNGFAQQLLEATTKTKPTHIKCDPSKHDSAWQWLQRWMAVTSSDIHVYELNQDHSEVLDDANLAASVAPNEVTSADFSVLPSTKLVLKEPANAEDGKEDSVTNTFDSPHTEPPASSPNLSSSEKVDQDNPRLQDQILEPAQPIQTMTEQGTEDASDYLSVQKPSQSDALTLSVPSSLSLKTEIENHSPSHTSKSEPLETEGKRFAFGSRRTCNPTFIAAQSKFEELSSTQSAVRPSKSISQDTVVKSKSEIVHSHVDPVTIIEDHNLPANSVSYDSNVPVASSECGTEISISSTLDSPDRSEAEGGEIVLEIGSLEKGNQAANHGAENVVDHVNLNAEAIKSSFDQETLHPQTFYEVERNETKLTVAPESVPAEKQQIESTTSDVKSHLENLNNKQVYQSSPEGSPRSHATGLESHGTPSSQISINAKMSKKDNNMPARKLKSQQAVKRSPSTPNNDSGRRNGSEHLPKDAKNAKRQSSIGAPKPDRVDHEPRVSNSNSLPSYMQATESARAKAHASISPKSSPDVHDKDYLKKRHSLPIANGKQGSSPRMQRSTSQAQQNVKGNGTHSPHNSAERRWQR